MIELHAGAVIVLALAGDVLFGDPPNRLHPVAWMGSAITVAGNIAPAQRKGLRFLRGLIVIGLGTVAMAAIGWTAEYGLRQCPLLVGGVAEAVLLKCCFSARTLADAANRVASALRQGDIPLARHQLGFHLVSRDVSTLNAPQLSAATIESVAENTSDSIVAPLFYFAVAGLPGVFVYRFVNTCDAMIGYRTEALEWYGKPAARFDDLLNFVPARITAVLMLLCGPLLTGRLRSSIAIWWRDHGRTASPNAGHPMSAAAGVLGIALEKKEHYLLGGEQPLPSVDSIGRGVKLLWASTVLFIGLLSAMLIFLACMEGTSVR